MSGEILYQPSKKQQQQSAMWRFVQDTAAYHQAEPSDYQALHQWSVQDPEHFYASLWDAMDIIGERGTTIIDTHADIRKTRLFPDSRLNYAENLLRGEDTSIAIIAHREDGTRRQLSWGELRAEVSCVVQALRAEGVTQGDRIAAIVTNDIEAIIAYLATTSIGAIWSSCSPDFGPVAASDRLCQVEPSVIIAVPTYRYGGKEYDVTTTVKAVANTPSLKRIVLLGEDSPASLAGQPTVGWMDWLQPYQPVTIQFSHFPATVPLAILFSSGTTGKPKCIVHSATGLLLQHKKEHILHCDLKAGERFFYFSTCGWMMWNWQVSGLAAGATLVTYDGNPMFPGLARLPDLIDAEDISVFGTSARYLDACATAGLVPAATHNLSRLRLVLSTGSPLLPAGFDYVYQSWKSDMDLASISGGTDICGCFLGGNPLLPVRRGELKCAMLGMAVDVVDDEGNTLLQKPGELVCRNAHLSMPLFFWGDVDGSRYHNAYFRRFADVWTHGDFAERTASGWIILGRSDTTLNPGGIRIGTAEIYRLLDQFDEIDETVVVGQQQGNDQRLVLFVKLLQGRMLDDTLEKSIRQKIRAGASPHHVPAVIIKVDDIPRTRSGKTSEAAVRDIINNRPLQNTAALANPWVLEQYRDLPQLKA